MGTSRGTISGWFDRGVAQGSKYMLVICDTYDWSDYPVYVETGKDCWSRYENPGNMAKVMEVYDLQRNKEIQMRAHRALSLPPKEADHESTK